MKRKHAPAMSNRELGGHHFGLMVYRYAYYVRGVSLVLDVEYDRLEREYTQAGGIIGLGSDREEDYHPSVREQANDEIMIMEHNVNHSGEKNPNSVLTKRLVFEIRRLHSMGFGYGWMATWLGVTKSCVQKVCNGSTWSKR
jgi:hypothetical protein